MFERINAVLKEYPMARDSDEMLMWYILTNMGYQLDRMTVTELLSKIDKKVLPAFETVARLRRRAQEEDPTLRGVNYSARQKATDEWQMALGYK